MIEATNIIKSYDKLQVLKNISLQVANEEIVCLVGASGAGKSTLLHILGTLDKPDSGKVLILDNRVVNEAYGKTFARIWNMKHVVANSVDDLKNFVS